MGISIGKIDRSTMPGYSISWNMVKGGKTIGNKQCRGKTKGRGKISMRWMGPSAMYGVAHANGVTVYF